MEGNSDGIAPALQQMEERSERRASTADAWISSGAGVSAVRAETLAYRAEAIVAR
jgi:hypothetical protein